MHDWRANNAEFYSLLERAGRFYQSIGAREFVANSVVEGRVHPSHSVARVVWQVLDAQSVELVSFEVTYIVRERQGQCAIVGLVAHNERRRMEERGLCAGGGADLYFDGSGQEFDAASGVRQSSFKLGATRSV